MILPFVWSRSQSRYSSLFLVVVVLDAFRHERKQRAEGPKEPGTWQGPCNQRQEADVKDQESHESVRLARRWKLITMRVIEKKAGWPHQVGRGVVPSCSCDWHKR